MATPAGSGGVEQTLVTSTLWFTVKSVALLTVVPSGLSTSSAYRRAEVSKEGGTMAVSSRSPVPMQVVVSGTPSRRTLAVVEPLLQLSGLPASPLPMTVRVSALGGATPCSVELTVNSLGYVSIMETGRRVAPSEKTDTLSSLW